MTNCTKKFWFFIFFPFVLASCGDHTPFEKHISEGVIEFEVTYPELDSNNVMLEMMPNRMLMTFKDDKYRSELKAAAGIIEMSVQVDAATHTMYNLVKIFGDRYVLKMNQAQAIEFSDVLPPFQLQDLEDNVELAGAECNKVLLDFGTSQDESYLFLYTDEIALKEPNWFTPYRQIEGVLLDYRIENYNMNMRLKAIRITPEEIDDSFFEIGSEYKELTPEEFDNLVVKNMEMFLE